MAKSKYTAKFKPDVTMRAAIQIIKDGRGTRFVRMLSTTRSFSRQNRMTPKGSSQWFRSSA